MVVADTGSGCYVYTVYVHTIVAASTLWSLCYTIHLNYYTIGLHNYFNCLVYSSNRNYATEMTFL